MNPIWDAIIVGGGPAGASCATWLARLGLAPLLLEAAPLLGGLTACNPFRDDWIVALPAVTGRDVAANIARSVELACEQTRLEVVTGARVTAVRRAADGFEVDCLQQGATRRHAGRTLVLATGVRPRPLDASRPGHAWPGVLCGPGEHIARADYAGRSVAILGGGDNAFENYAYVRGRGAASVQVYARTVRAQRQLVRAVADGDLHVGAYQVDPETRQVQGRTYDLILVFYGWEPRADFADGLALRRDERGFIRTDPDSAVTSVPGCYAVGEVARRMHPCVVTAMADGVVAAKAIERALQA